QIVAERELLQDIVAGFAAGCHLTTGRLARGLAFAAAHAQLVEPALAVVRAVAGCAWGWLEERLVEDDFTVEHQRTLLANRLTGGIRHVDTASVEDVGE